MTVRELPRQPGCLPLVAFTRERNAHGQATVTLGFLSFVAETILINVGYIK